MKKLILLTLLLTPVLSTYAQVHLRYDRNETLTYDEIIRAYRTLDEQYETARLIEAGPTDVGKPLHLFILSGKKIFDPAAIAASGMPVIFINNGIHPGEPEGIDASIQLASDILSNKDGMGRYLNKVIICIIPVYNVGGVLDRSAYHRANQDTPPETGFRGNGKHLDLNRDLSKPTAAMPAPSNGCSASSTPWSSSIPTPPTARITSIPLPSSPRCTRR